MPTPKASGRRSRKRKFTPIVCLRLTALIAFLLALCWLLVFAISTTFTSLIISRQATGQVRTTTASSLRWSFTQSQHRYQAQHFHTPEQFIATTQRKRKQDHRIAIFLPMIGKGAHEIPAHLEAFCFGAIGAADVADFIVIHNGFLSMHHPFNHECPSNVMFVNMNNSTEELARYMSRVVTVDEHGVDKDAKLAVGSPETLVKVLAYHIERNPYALVEFKPALGHIFADFIRHSSHNAEGDGGEVKHYYSHWGYADMDILFGDLSRWITPDEWTDYDIVTYTFGDQSRLYIRGQFTIHKNTVKASNVWRACSYLSEIDLRYAKVLIPKDGDDKQNKLQFESAEGCYSDAVLSRNDLTVKYAPKAWSDVQNSDSVHAQGLYVTRTPEHRVVLYKPPKVNKGKMMANVSQSKPLWFEGGDLYYSDRSLPLHIAEGEMIPIDLPNDPEAKCMYWAKKTHQSKLCLNDDELKDRYNIIWKNGQLYKQAIKRHELDSTILTAPFFHFQDWKRSFRPALLSPLHLTSPAASFILFGSGVLPLYNRGSVPTIPLIPSPLNILPRQWLGRYTESVRDQLPSRQYCVITKVMQNPDRAACQSVITWKGADTVELLSTAPAWTAIDVERDVTLTLTLEITRMQTESSSLLKVAVDQLLENFHRWKTAPCVVVIYVALNDPQAQSYVRHRFADLHSALDNALVALVHPHHLGKKDQNELENHSFEFISRRALLNMAMDAVPTRYFVNGLEVERGQVLSTESVFFVHRAIDALQKSGSTNHGRALWLPQFAVEEGSLDMSLSDLHELSKKGKVHMPEYFKETCDEPEGEHLNMTDTLWWKYTDEILADPSHPVDQTNIDDKVAEVGFLNEWLIKILVDDTDNLESIYYLDESPILLLDNLGPVHGARTTEIVREAEELAGRRCYNGVRVGLLAALGYHFDVVPGAFALSTNASSLQLLHSIAPVNETATPSRCRGCFTYRGHYLLADDVADSDISRIVKTRLAWAENTKGELEWEF